MKIKKRVYRIMQPHKHNDIPSMIFDWFIYALIASNTLIILLDTVSFPEEVLNAFRALETAIVIIFTVEYVLRLWTSDILYKGKNPFSARLRYAVTFFMVIDILSILPFYLHLIFLFDVNILRLFRLFRMFRLIKVKRYVKALSHIGHILRSKASQLLASVFIIITLMTSASVLMYIFENETQPEAFGNAFSGLWWSISTITTVGYGDIYPITVFGRVLAAAFSILSIGLIAVPTGIISAGFIEKSHEDKMAARGSRPFCPYCGKDIGD